MKSGLLIAFLTATFALSSCTSRYTMDLYLLSGTKATRIDVEQTQFAGMTVLGSPLAEEKIVQGMGNTIMIGTGARGEREAKESQYDVFAFDEYLRYRIYIQLPVTLDRRTVPLQGNSFAEVLGRYDQPPEANVFLAESGSFVVDSVAAKHLFGTIKKGIFANSKGGKVTFDGRFKVKVAD